MVARVVGVRVGDVMVDWALDHFSGDIVAELGDLFADVSEESVARPAAEEHDGVDGDAIEVHRHCRGGSNGMEANVGRGEAIVGVYCVDEGA